MSRYSDFLYSTKEYGQAPRASSLSRIEGRTVDFGTVRVLIDCSNRFGFPYVLTRSTNGAAEDPTDGLTIASGRVSTTKFSVEDNPPDGMSYYTLFVFDGDGRWVKDAATSVLCPQTRRGYLKLLQALPRMFLDDDLNPLAPFSNESFMARFLYGVGLTLDELGTYTDLVLPESRSLQGVRRMSHAWAAGLGFDPEAELGTASSYRLHRDSGLIYTRKGTKTGVVAYVEALTGWGATVSKYENLLPTLDDASFENSSGGWGITGADFSIAEVVSSATPEDGEQPIFEVPNDYPTSRFARKGAGRFTLTATDVELRLPATPSVGSLIPAYENRIYVFKVPARASLGTPDITASLIWYDHRGNEISQSSSAPVVLDPEESYVVVAVDNPAPAGTRFVGLTIHINGAVGDVVDMDRLSLMDGYGPYRDPNSITIICAPDRVNLLSDPSFEEDGFWSAAEGTLTLSEAAAVQGSFGAEITGDPYLLTSESVPALPGFSVTLSGQIRCDQNASVGVSFRDASGEEVSRPSVTVLASEQFVPFSLVAQVPVGAQSLLVTVEGSGTAYLDLLSLDREERPQVYFDGRTSNANQDDSRYAVYDGHVYSLLYNNRLSKLIRLKQSLQDYLPLGITARIVFWDATDDEVQAILPYGVDLDAPGPDAPQELSALPGDERIFISFAPGSTDETVVNYSYSLDDGVTWTDRAPASTSTEFTVFGYASGTSGSGRTLKYSDITDYIDYAYLSEENATYGELAVPVVGPFTSIVNGKTYYVRVRGITSTGKFTSTSGAVVVKPRRLPTPPVITSVIPDDESATVAFSQGATNGAAISVYQYSLDDGESWDIAYSPLELTGLSNGTTYSVVIRSFSDAGYSEPSASASFVPRTFALAPSITNVTPGDGRLTLTFNAPLFNGGRPILNYEFSVNNGAEWTACNPATTSGTITIQGLANGVEYSVRLRAVTEVGPGEASLPALSTPRTVPGPPTITRIQASDRALLVSFQIADNGGAPVSNVEYSTNNGSTWVTRSPADATSAVNIPGLVNGTNYSVRLRAVNVAGSGAASSAVVGRPVVAPNPPVGLAATPSNQQVALTWTAPTSDGGSPIAYYLVDLNPSAGTVTYPLDRSVPGASITGLTNGTSYTFNVTAVNDAGLRSPAVAIAATPRTVPSAPSGIIPVRGDRRVTLSWTPGFDGGSPVTNYRVRFSTNAGTSWSSGQLTGSAEPSFTVTNLTAGSSYIFQVRAVNAAGEGTYSQPSPASIPAEPAMPPNNLVVAVDPTVTTTGSVSTTSAILVSWQAPSNASIAGISDYVVEISSNSGSTWSQVDTTTSLQYRITRLPNGIPVEVRVAARGIAGRGAYEESDPITPAGPPTAPVVTSAAAANGTITVYFTVAGNGSPITNVQYSLATSPDSRPVWQDFNPQTISSPAVIQGVTNGVKYFVTLRAINAIGTSPLSNQITATAQGLPSAPTITAFTSVSRTVLSYTLYRWVIVNTTTLSFTPPTDNGGSPITSYDVSIDNGSSVWATTNTVTSPLSFSSLVSPGRLIRLRAKTALGTGPWSAPFAF